MITGSSRKQGRPCFYRASWLSVFAKQLTHRALFPSSSRDAARQRKQATSHERGRNEGQTKEKEGTHMG